MLIRYLLVIAMIGLVAAPLSAALAHDIAVGPHGGPLEDANPGPSLHFEVVLKSSTISVYLFSEDGTPVAASGVSGSATVLVNKKKEQVTLAPAGANLLTGTGTFGAGPDMRMLVSLVIAGATQRALFSRLNP